MASAYAHEELESQNVVELGRTAFAHRDQLRAVVLLGDRTTDQRD